MQSWRYTDDETTVRRQIIQSSVRLYLKQKMATKWNPFDIILYFSLICNPQANLILPRICFRSLILSIAFTGHTAWYTSFGCNKKAERVTSFEQIWSEKQIEKLTVMMIYWARILDCCVYQPQWYSIRLDGIILKKNIWTTYAITNTCCNVYSCFKTQRLF